VYHVRKPEKERLFSAARFLAKVKECFVDGHAPSPEDVQRIYDSYEKTLQSIWDVSKGDYKTKKALFDNAIRDFIDKKLYKRIDTLCTFTDAGFTSLKTARKTQTHGATKVEQPS
jgi:hypothetical protein